MPLGRNKTISIQQDNASPHASAAAAVADSNLDGWRVEIRRQPPRSPDLNILDLGFFNAIQSLQHTKRTTSVKTLIDAVCEAFAEMEVRTLEKCFLTLQCVMEQIMLVKGGNNYELPRVSARFPNGDMPTSLVCPEDSYLSGKVGIKQY
jgi:hypothetical protein